MHLTKPAAAVTAACVICASAGTGWGHDSANHHPPGQAESSEAGAFVAGSNADAFDGTVIERTLADGRAETIVVPLGAAVRLILHAPAGTELHLHGYELAGTAADEVPVVMTFRAEHLGRFPIESHGIEDLLGRAHKALAYLEVRPE